MISVTCRRPFSELGDQQLLEQARRLAANQRCLEVHILDHLDEIDRRGLALRRGFSSLFDYAVRELRFTDAAAQRRIQAMRLCRRHGWVRASLHSGELSMTAAAQLETTFAGAERAERQSRTGLRNGGQGRCHGQEKDDDPSRRTRQLGQPAAPGEASEQGDGGPQSAPGRAPRTAQSSSDAAAAQGVAPAGARDRGAGHALPAGGGGTVVPVAVQDRGAGHAGVLRPPQQSGRGDDGGRDACHPAAELNENAASSLAARRVPVSAAPSSDDGRAPRVSPTIRSTQAPEPVAAPSPSLPVASRVPDSPRDDPFAELSPGPLSIAPLLHPQRQRELIEQAAGLSTRQVAGLLADAAPEVVPARDTLRAVGPDRYTLKVSIDQECEQGLRRLKGLLSHLDPRMSWGDLVARVVREAVARHDPRGGVSGPRRRRAGSAGASRKRAPNKTRAAGAAAAPAQRGNESSRRAPHRTRAAAAPAQRGSDSPAPQGNRTRPVAAPTAPAQHTGSDSPAPQGNRTRPAAAPTAPAQRAGGDSPAPQGNRTRPAAAPTAPAQRTGSDSPAPQGNRTRLGAAPTKPARRAGSDTPAPQGNKTRLGAAPTAPAQRVGGDSPAPQGATAAAGTRNPIAMAPDAAAPRLSTSAAPALGARAGGVPAGAPAAAAAPQFATGAAAHRSPAGAAVPFSPVATAAPQPALGVDPDGAPSGASSAVAGAHTSRGSIRNSHQSPPRRHIPAAVRRLVWHRDQGRCVYRDPLTGRRCTSSHLLQIDHLLPVAEGGGPDPANLAIRCFSHHRMRHGYGPAPLPEPPM